MDCSPQSPLSMWFPRHEYWSRLPFPSPRGFPNPGIKPMSLSLQEDYLPLSHQRSPPMQHRCIWHIYKVFDKFYVNFIIPFDILSTLGFLSLGTVDIWGWIILCCGKMMCIVEYLAASWIPPHWKPVVHPTTATTKNVSRHCQMSFGGKSPQSRTTGLTNNWDHKVLL